MAPPQDIPNHRQPYDQWAEGQLLQAIEHHTLWCKEHGVGADVLRIRLRLAYLIGFMAGSGVLGGLAGAVAARLLGGQ